MRRTVLFAAVLILAGCGIGVPSIAPHSVQPSRPPSASPRPSSAPVPSEVAAASPTTAPAATRVPTPDQALVGAATAYALRAGFELADDVPTTINDQSTDFDPLVMHRVSLALADGYGAMLKVFLDDGGTVHVVEDGVYDRPTGAPITRSEAIRVAARHLREAGVGLGGGKLHVAAYAAGHWYLTLDREIDGYPVANAPMAWWLDGDKAYLELRADGSLAYLSAIVRDHEARPRILALSTLKTRLATWAQVHIGTLSTFDRRFVWVLPNEPEATKINARLVLGYCATHRWSAGWEAWCVDVGTGRGLVHGSGID